jgi:hypothetical protein
VTANGKTYPSGSIIEDISDADARSLGALLEQV